MSAPEYCSGGAKRRYISRSEATGALAVLYAHKDRGRVKGMRAYRCETCGGWHLGHDSKAKRPYHRFKKRRGRS